MYFLFPQAWYLLPLVVIPFLINLQRYFNRETVQIPSLFFLEKLLRKSHVQRQARLWELLAEFFFLLGLIFLLSRPVFAEPKLGHNRLLLLLDNSPSMQYYFISSENPFFEDLKKKLEEKTYEQIDVFPLSQLGNQEPFSLTSPEDVEKFYRLLPRIVGGWTLERVQDFFHDPEVARLYQNYDFMVYSDHRGNHFSPETIPAAFPPYLNVIELPPTPALLRANLKNENLFAQESLEISISANPGEDQEIFLTVRLDEEVVFRKQVTGQGEPVDFEVKVPATARARGTDPTSIRRVTIALDKAGTPFQEITRIINVYSPKTVALIPPQHPSVEFFKTIFGYDLERGNLGLSANLNTADTFLILDPTHIPSPMPSGKHIFLFLNPGESTILMNQILKKWGVTSFAIDRKKNSGVLDKLESPHFKNSISPSSINIESYFTFDFITPPEFTSVTVQKHPLIFRSGNFGIFNGIAPEDMGTEIVPEHLIWIYEILFSFWGKKNVIYTFPSFENLGTMKSSGAPGTERLAPDDPEGVVTVYSPRIEEFTSAVTENAWETLSPQVIRFSLSDKNPAKEPIESMESMESAESMEPITAKAEEVNIPTGSIPWVGIAAIIEIILLGLIAYAFTRRVLHLH